MTTEDRHVHWRINIGNQAAGGMNIAAYCRESHIHPSLFYPRSTRSRIRLSPIQNMQVILTAS